MMYVLYVHTAVGEKAEGTSNSVESSLYIVRICSIS